MALTDNLNAALDAAAAALAEARMDAGNVQSVHDREIARRDARIAELEAQTTPEPTPAPRITTFGIDISDLGADEPLSEKQKLDSHRALMGGGGLGVVRVFVQTQPLGPTLWNVDRLQGLTAADDVHITTNLAVRNVRAGLRSMLDSTPDKFRQRPGQIQWGVRHEMEADLTTQTAIDSWLNDNLAMAEELDAADGYTADDLIKTLLFYSQHVDYKGSWRKFWGGQNFGKIGMDCYHLQAQLNRVVDGKPAGSYTPAATLFGYLKTIKAETGRPVCVPEWGGTLANTDPTGAGRAKAIEEGAVFLESIGATHASWWCADGSKDPQGNVRKHHLEQVSGPTSPEVTAYRALMAA